MTQEPQVEQPSRIIARMSKEWRNRQFMIIGILLAFSAWFFFDAFVGFPARNEAFDAYKKLEADKQGQQWTTLASSRGWSVKPPEKRYSEGDINGQVVYASICAMGGLWALGLVLRARMRCISLVDGMVTDESGCCVPLSAFTRLDVSKWDRKSIVLCHYSIGGHEGTLKLDDFKFAGCDEILHVVDQEMEARKTPSKKGQTKTPF